MEKKYKISEFAELIGVTAKTVYKMEERNEIITVNEKVNGREIKLVVISEDDIKELRTMNGKNTDNNRNYEDMLTDNNDTMNFNNRSENNNNNISMSDMFDKLIQMNEKYNNDIRTLNNELIEYKSRIPFLEDTASREGLYLAEINELKTEKEQLKTSKQKVIISLVSVIICLCITLSVMITVNIVSNSTEKNIAQKKELPQPVQIEQVKKVQKK